MAGLELIVGTYEEYTVGYKSDPLKTDPSRLYLKEIFSTHNHTASVRVLATHGKYLASGGADDRICIFDLENGTLKDELLHHNGTINCLTFTPDGSYLFSGSHDGTISAINMKKLAVDKTWKNAHKGPVLCITIHPQGNIALSLGSDMSLKTWDLVTGRTIYTRGLRSDTKFGGFLSWVEWSPDGTHFALMGNRVVDVVSVETTSSIRTVKCSSKPVSFCWISETEVAVGLDDGHLLMFDIDDDDEEGGEPEKIKAYDSRLKAVAMVADHLATVSSSGDISLWKIDGDDFHEVCTTNIGCRPTCLVTTEADKLGLHKYLSKQEDNKDELRKQLKTIQAIGTVTVEHEDPVQEASEKSSKAKKNKKRALALEEPTKPASFSSTPVAKKPKKDLVASATKKSAAKKKSANVSAAGVWEEEDLDEEAPSLGKKPEEKTKPQKKKQQERLNQTVGNGGGGGSTKLKKNKNQGRRGSL